MYLTNVTSGKGLRLATITGIFIPSSATTVGTTYMVAEDTDAPDISGVTDPNSGAASGALANILTVPNTVSEGLSETVPVLPFYALATEVAAAGAPCRCVLEGYYVDAIVFNSSTQIEPRRPLTVRNTQGDLTQWIQQATIGAAGTTIGTPIHARLLKRMASSASSSLQKVHFRGFPGGFGVGPGAAA